MRLASDEWASLLLKILGVGVILFLMKKVVTIFKGPDQKFSVAEFGKFVGFFIFTGLGVHIILKEGNRQHEWTYYSETHLFLVFSGMLTVLHLDAALDKFLKIMEIALKMRAKITSISSEETSEKKTVITENKDIDESKL